MNYICQTGTWSLINFPQLSLKIAMILMHIPSLNIFQQLLRASEDHK